MEKLKALVIGGTGPTGPAIVEGLHRRGYDVTIFHSGQHEVEFAVPVEHIHEDPHFKETIERGIGSRTFDLVLILYGRLRVISEFMKGRAGRIIAIGTASGLYAPATDERWGKLGPPQLIPDETTIFRRDGSGADMDKLQFRMVQAMESFFEHHPRGTYVGYPTNYGPRQPAAHDWSTIRRVLDGRKSMIVADGGLKLETRIYTENAAQAVLLVVDKPEIAAGKRYTLGDRHCYSVRQRIEFVAGYMGVQLEIADLPYELAWPCYPYYRYTRGHRLSDSSLIRRELGYEDLVSAETGLARTVDWLVANRPEPGGEAERQIGDPFDYDGEDALVARWRSALSEIGEVRRDVPSPGHPYRHPKKPGETWTSRAQNIP